MRELVRGLGVEPGGRVLEIACGDGTFSRWLGEQTGPEGRVLGIDLCEGFIDEARRAARDMPWVDFEVADFRAPIDEDEAFDYAFCAFSLYSLPDPQEVVGQMARRVRPGGAVIVLEDDHAHHVMLPWPPELELAVRAAELEYLEQLDDNAKEKYFVPRWLPELFGRAGLEAVEAHSFAVSRVSPFDPAEAAFLRHWCDGLERRAGPHLSEDDARRFRRWVAPDNPEGLFGAEGLHVRFLHSIVKGATPVDDARTEPSPRARSVST